MWQRVIAYVLMATGFVVTLFFQHYTGTLIPYSFLFFLLAVAVWDIGKRLLRKAGQKELKAFYDAQVVVVIQELKNTGERIVVDLSACEVKEQEYTEERETSAPSSIYGVSINNVVQAQVIQSVISYTHTDSSGYTERFYSPIIPKDRTTVSFYMGRQKQTTLYVDKTNRKRYYFDIAFIYAEH